MTAHNSTPTKARRSPTRRRWVCTDCGSGCLAPGRMAKDDTRRYCLPCSTRTGKLVPRTCPALETKRQDAAERTKERAARKRARETAKVSTQDGVPWERIARKAKALRAWSDEHPRAARWVGMATHRFKRGSSGSYAYQRRNHITIQVSGRNDHHRLSVLVIHELAHLFCYRAGLEVSKGTRRRQAHGRNFHAVLRSAVECYWPDLKRPDVAAAVTAHYQEQGGSRRAYSMDRALRHGLALLTT